MAFEDNVLKAGTTLNNGKYAIRRVLGQGGFGITYEATQVLLGKRVALKECFLNGVCDRASDGVSVFVLKSSQDLFQKQKRRFLNEARRLANLSNPHIVPVFDLFEENGTAYYVMDFIEGESLYDMIKRSGRPFNEEYVKDILDQLLDALTEIHHQNPPLCHLDIKPANIMVNQEGTILLVDFGASKYVSTSEESQSSSSVAYTPGYAPIEQLAGIREDMGPWTDFYALGATLFNLLTCQKPANPSVINNDSSPHRQDSIPLPSSLSERTRRLILWLMDPNQNARPRSEDEIRRFLRKDYEEFVFNNPGVNNDGEEDTIDVEATNMGDDNRTSSERDGFKRNEAGSYGFGGFDGSQKAQNSQKAQKSRKSQRSRRPKDFQNVRNSHGYQFFHKSTESQNPDEPKSCLKTLWKWCKWCAIIILIWYALCFLILFL